MSGVFPQEQRALVMVIVVTETGLRLRLSGFGFGSIYFSLNVTAKMVIRDSRGKENANNSWKVRLSCEPTLSRSADKLTSAGRGGEGGFDQ